MPRIISEPRYLDGLQCHKLLWYRYNGKDHMPAVDPSAQVIFDQGEMVGAYARILFPGGVEIQA
jgi:hypothetical protein